MNIVLDTYLFDALQAELEGVKFSIDFDVVWETYGFSKFFNARKYIKKNAEILIALGLLQVESKNINQPELDKYYLCLKGYKFSLARAKTQEGAEYLLHLLDIEERFVATLNHQLAAPAYTAPTFSYPIAQLQAIANYCTLAYTKAAIRRDYVEGLHYVMVGSEMMLSEICFGLTVNASRSRAGVDLENCPDIQISIRDAIAHHNAKAANKQNARLTRQSECPGQLSFALG
jgi:hypothetical protein